MIFLNKDKFIFDLYYFISLLLNDSELTDTQANKRGAERIVPIGIAITVVEREHSCISSVASVASAIEPWIRAIL